MMPKGVPDHRQLTFHWGNRERGASEWDKPAHLCRRCGEIIPAERSAGAMRRSCFACERANQHVRLLLVDDVMCPGCGTWFVPGPREMRLVLDGYTVRCIACGPEDLTEDLMIPEPVWDLTSDHIDIVAVARMTGLAVDPRTGRAKDPADRRRTHHGTD